MKGFDFHSPGARSSHFALLMTGVGLTLAIVILGAAIGHGLA